MLFQYIGDHGLAEFVIDGLKKGIHVDVGAMRDILEKTSELRKLSLRNANEIKSESLGDLITMIRDLIQSQPPRLTELDFGGIGGSAEQGSNLLEAIYETGTQFKKLDICDNLMWTRSENYL